MNKILSMLTDPLCIRKCFPLEESRPTATKIANFTTRSALAVPVVWASFNLDTAFPSIIPMCIGFGSSTLVSLGAYFGGKAIIQIASGEGDAVQLIFECGIVGLSYLLIAYQDLCDNLGANRFLDRMVVDVIKLAYRKCTSGGHELPVVQ